MGFLLGKIKGMKILAGVLSGALFLTAGLPFEERGHGGVNITPTVWTESSKELHNPNCGFYYMHGFYIEDVEMDFRKEIAGRFCMDENTDVTMIQINLANYRKGAISEQGLKNIDFLFEVLGRVDKQLIVRFLYDWDGKCEGHEPDDISIIETHMEQVAPIVNQYKGQILCLQGLFIGNWGEMNGTPFSDAASIKRLSAKWDEVLDKDIYICVRMPMFWRISTGTADPAGLQKDGSMASRMGLYNDGMLGSYSDYGTYGNHTREEDGDFTYWNREEELAFQELLCRIVPQGGEVIIDNAYNDLEKAIPDLRRMHISYLNRDFDRNVYKKWANSTANTGDVFDGMDGLSYVERHVGYRLVIEDVRLTYSYKEDTVKSVLTVKNVGFAPPYKPTNSYLKIVDKNTGDLRIYPVEADFSVLYGGVDDGLFLTVEKEISLKGYPAGSYEMYLAVEDAASGMPIEFGNDAELTDTGYLLGTMEISEVPAFAQ